MHVMAADFEGDPRQHQLSAAAGARVRVVAVLPSGWAFVTLGRANGRVCLGVCVLCFLCV